MLHDLLAEYISRAAALKESDRIPYRLFPIVSVRDHDAYVLRDAMDMGGHDACLCHWAMVSSR